MKKKLFNLIIFSITIVFSMGIFVGISSLVKNKTANAESIQPQAETTIFDFITIAQEDTIFTEQNLIYKESDGYYYLYSTKGTTITFKNEGTYKYNFNLTTYPSGVIKNLSFNFENNTLSNPEALSDYYKQIDGVYYYHFNPKESSINEQTLNISYTRIIYSGHNIFYNTYSMNLKLVYVQNDFNNPNTIKWKDDNNYSPAPQKTIEPKIVTLEFENTTKTSNDIIFVDFEFNGEKYNVYFDPSNQKFYNNLNTPEEIAGLTNSISFDRSGKYTVEIYDKTYICNNNSKNYQHYEFSIKTDAPFYFTATTKDNEGNLDLLGYGQATNNETTLTFNNYSSIRNFIHYTEGIQVTHTYMPSVSQNVSETIIYEAGTFSSAKNELKFTKDGNYHIVIYSKENQIISEFAFRIIKDIRSYFVIDGEEYRVDAGVKENQTITKTHTGTVERVYKEGISGFSEYSIDLKIANSSPAINGVSNNARTSNPVDIEVRGVGNITVSVSQDGKVSTTIYKDGDKLPTFTEQGKYFIKLTDEMGNETSKSFSITIKLNAAAIILIVLAAAIVVLAIITFIVSRFRIKVR